MEDLLRLTILPLTRMTISWREAGQAMELIQDLLTAVLLLIWAIGSIALVICLIQNFIIDRKREKREEARAKRDKEYHGKRMSALR